MKTPLVDSESGGDTRIANG
jgi:nitrate/nitrite transporter NarK